MNDNDSPQSPPTAEQSDPPPQAPLLELRDPLPEVVDTEAALQDVVDRVRGGTGPFAIDAERASGYRYSHRAYLVQLRREGAGTALIDPAPFGDVPNTSLQGLADAVGDAEWIIHAASQDILCLAELGLRPRRLFDTELAGRLLNYPRVGLAVLTEELLGFRMRKEHSAVDWSRRPLPEPWLRYAALDVELLVELRDILSDQLDAAGKREWAEQEFAMWAAYESAPVRAEPWRRTSGIHRVRGRRGLGIVRSMWELRNQIAQNRDITTNRIIPDAAIIEAAQAAPRSRNALLKLPSFNNRSGQRYAKEFAAAINETLELPDTALPSLSQQHDGPPPPRSWADKNPAAATRLGRCREVVGALAVEHDLPQENLISPDFVRRLAWEPPEPPSVDNVRANLTGNGARPWQVDLTAAALADALLEPSDT